MRPSTALALGVVLAVVVHVAVPAAADPIRVGTRWVTLPLEPEARVESVVTQGEAWAVGATLATAAGVEPRWVEGAGDSAKAVAGPSGVRAPMLRSPRPLLAGGRLGAVAWLEGDAVTRLAVRAAVRRGDGWGETTTVAATGPGSQLALAAATLDDGSWLLVWSAFDGGDDEILWSRHDDAGWSRPAPLAAGNAVPDITPHVAAVPGGALAAWSRYDGGGYQVVVARFSGAGWGEPAAVAARGSHFPTVEVWGDAVAVLYQRSVPAGWGLAELDRFDAVRRTAFVETRRDDRPHLGTPGAGGVAFRWDAEAAELLGAWGETGAAER